MCSSSLYYAESNEKKLDPKKLNNSDLLLNFSLPQLAKYYNRLSEIVWN